MCRFALHIDEGYSCFVCSLFRSVCVFVLILFTTQSKSYRHPVSNTYASFIPHKNIYITSTYTHIIKHTDISPIIRNILNLTSAHQNILEQAHLANISKLEVNTFSKHTCDSIETLAKHLKNAIQTLYHTEGCHQTRAKRNTDLIQPTGIFPEVGHLWSWLTGALTSDAAAIINRNSRDLMILKQAQAKSLQVINHTIIQSHRNALQLKTLNIKLNALSMHLSTQIENVDNKIIISNMFNDLMFSVKQLHKSVEEMITEWHWASIGKMGPNAFNHGLFTAIEHTLDPVTRNIHNIRHIIKRAAEITIEACASHTYIKIKVPLLETTPLPSYKIHTNPRWHIDHYEQIVTNATILAWTQHNTYQFTKSESTQCTNLKTSLICKPPKMTFPLTHSCLFNILHDTEHTTEVCKVHIVPTPLLTLTQDGNFVIYTIPNNESQLLNQKCGTKPLTVKQITGSGMVHIKEDCKLAIGNVTFSNNMKTYIFNSSPLILKINSDISLKHHSFSDTVKVENATVYPINEDMEALNVASQLLGQFEVNPDIIIVASGISTIILFTVLILVIILYTHICCSPIQGCHKQADSINRFPIYRGSTR